MNQVFWNNTIWYVMLAVISSVVLILALYKSYKAKSIKLAMAFFASIIGFVYYIESILALSLNAYAYHPEITPADEFQDIVLGNVFSQTSIASVALLTSVFELSWIWYFTFAGIYFLIEELFLKLGIYQQFWYKSWYTTGGLIVIFWLIKKWYKTMSGSPGYTVCYITLFLAGAGAFLSTVTIPLKLLGIQIFKAGFFAELSKNHTTVALIVAFFLINVLINVHRWKLNWISQCVVFACLFMVLYALHRAGVIYIRPGWPFAVLLLDLFAAYFYIAIFDNIFSKRERAST